MTGFTAMGNKLENLKEHVEKDTKSPLSNLTNIWKTFHH